MKLGFNEATCMKNSSVEQDLLLCEKYGYDYIELNLDMVKVYLETHTLADLKEFFDTHHLKPFALNAIENVNFCSEEEWVQIITDFTFACEVAQAIDNPYIILVPTITEELNPHTEDEVLEDAVKVLTELSDIAKDYGVKPAYEPIGDKHCCCTSIRQAREIIEAVDRDNIGIAIDDINIYMFDKCTDLAEIRKIPEGKLFVYHWNDCEDRPLGKLDDSHRLMPGEGVIPLDKFEEELTAWGYDGPACLELFRPEYWEMPAEEVIRMGREAWDRR